MSETHPATPLFISLLLVILVAITFMGLRAGGLPAAAPARPVRIAFMTDRDGDYEVYLMARDGSDLTNLTADAAADGLPTWSARANAFAFVTTREGVNGLGIFRMDADGSHPIGLSMDRPVDVAPPRWSPTGEWVAFGSGRDSNPDVYVVDAAGKVERNLTDDPAQDIFAGWSPDGQQLLFVSDRDGPLAIYAVGIQGGKPRRLTDLDSDNTRPAWSPDGRHIAFLSNRAEGADVEIFVMDAEGGNVTRLTASDGFDGFPAWSADGRRIAFVSGRDGNAEIYAMASDGSAPANLTNNPAQDSVQGDFAWSPDGKQILFQSDRDGNTEVYVMNADGSHQTNLSNSPTNDLASIWVP